MEDNVVFLAEKCLILIIYPLLQKQEMKSFLQRNRKGKYTILKHKTKPDLAQTLIRELCITTGMVLSSKL